MSPTASLPPRDVRVTLLKPHPRDTLWDNRSLHRAAGVARAGGRQIRPLQMHHPRQRRLCLASLRCLHAAESIKRVRKTTGCSWSYAGARATSSATCPLRRTALFPSQHLQDKTSCFRKNKPDKNFCWMLFLAKAIMTFQEHFPSSVSPAKPHAFSAWHVLKV